MDKKPLISVIIPVYKVEDYIERCVRSLFSQTIVDNIEFIFVDDKSPDNSVDIIINLITEYDINRERVKIIRLSKNSGSSNARYVGIKSVSGEYIGFCDSDDWVEPNMYESLLKCASHNNSDIVCCNYFRNSNSAQTSVIYDTPKDIIGDILSNIYPTCIWGKLFSRKLFHPVNKIVFPKGDMGEDFVYCIQSILKAVKISYIKIPLYHYCINHNSISNHSSIQSIVKRTEDLKNNSDQVFDLLNEYGIADKYKDSIIARKILVKIMLSSAMNNYNVKKLFNNIYPEINASVYFKNIPFELKKAYFLAATGIKAQLTNIAK